MHYLGLYPQDAVYHQIRLNRDRSLVSSDLDRVAQHAVVVEARQNLAALYQAATDGRSALPLGGTRMLTRIGRWELDIDPVLTADCFARYPNDALCTCDGCKNFRALGENAFPIPFRALAAQLGIDLSKPSELCHYGEGELRDLHGWFHLIGSIRSGRDAWRQISETSWTTVTEPVFGLSGLGFTDNIALLPEAFKGLPIVQLEFQTKVPRVLDDSRSGGN
jgi:hypothetical protein